MSAVAITENAVRKVLQLKTAENNDDLMLRLYITGGGCSGFSYGFKFDQESNDDDTLIESNGVTLLIDSLSIQYLESSVVDYKEGLMGSQFVVDNPNATATCGCGSSFSI